MSISNHLNLTKHAGDKINFLLQQSGITLFPFIINNTFDDIDGQLKMSSFEFSFNFLIDVEHLVCLKFSYLNRSYYDPSIINPTLNFSSEPLYEFGNEEEYLPQISSFKTIYSTHEFLEHIQHKLQQFFLVLTDLKFNDETIYKAFLKSWNEFCIDYDTKKEIDSNTNHNFHDIHREEISYHIVSTLKLYDKNENNIRQKIAKLKA